MDTAGAAQGDLALEALVSPFDRRSVNLVVSLVNVGTSAAPVEWPGAVLSAEFPGQVSGRESAHAICEGILNARQAYGKEDGVHISSGTRADDYCILLRDAAGKAVPLTAAGRTWMAGHGLKRKNLLRPGEAVGFIFPVQEMFDLKPGVEYTALAVLPGKRQNDAGLASLPVVFRADSRDSRREQAAARLATVLEQACRDSLRRSSRSVRRMQDHAGLLCGLPRYAAAKPFQSCGYPVGE